MSGFGVETVSLDLPPLAGAFSRRLHAAGVAVSAEHAARFARALTLTRPVGRRRLYWTARAVFVSDPSQVRVFDRVFADVFGGGPAVPAPPPEDAEVRPVTGEADARPPAPARSAGAAAGEAAAARPGRDEPAPHEVPLAVLASDEEVLRGKRFDALDAEELATLQRLMSRLALATPWRRTRRAERWRHGAAFDMRRTLRASLRTGGEPVRLARRRRRMVQRRLVLLCDISGSMEPYARAYLQFLTCAAGAGPRAEAFVFATRLTRLTRALHSRNPERAIHRAAAAAPDWSSGTRIGEALKSFNDRHGRRGMARGAVIVILSDGWERGEPALVAREMERLSRLAHRIIWVNPRVAAAGFVPRTGGMAAALPFCDELVSGHSLAALEEVIDAIAGDRPAVPGRLSPPVPAPAEDSWPSATPVAGSSVAMPSGYGPSRGRTTPGWSS
ncbi:MAG TPA: VWA domain-containing protein [Solirubrobacteraceae bacterium]|nr:VWA domain-containing protein [Solirubrobacteraceae bacterium]